MAGITSTFVDADTFTVLGDLTANFLPGRRVKCDCGVDGIKYGTIVSSAYTSLTTIDLTAASDDLTSNLTESWFGMIGADDNTMSMPDHAHDGAEASGGSIDNITEGNSDVTVTDAGTGEVTATVDGVEVLDLTDGVQRLGANGDSRVLVSQDGDSVSIYAANQQIIGGSATQVSIGNFGDAKMVIDSGTDEVTIDAAGNEEVSITDDGVQLGAAGARVNGVLDEDDMNSDSAVKLTTQQSQKAFAEIGNAAIEQVITSTAEAVAWDMNNGRSAVHTLTENTTISAPSNLKAGVTYNLRVVQAAGIYTLAFNAVFEFGVPAASVAPAADGDVIIITGYSDGTTIYVLELNRTEA